MEQEQIDETRLAAELMEDEGERLMPYLDSKGIWTVGVGRNLEQVGLSTREVIECLKQTGITRDIQAMLLKHDIKRVLNDSRFRAICRGHNAVRQEVLANMAFNMGLDRLLKFHKMLHWLARAAAVDDPALKQEAYEGAAAEMLDSAWAVQVGTREDELVARMRAGTFVELPGR